MLAFNIADWKNLLEILGFAKAGLELLNEDTGGRASPLDGEIKRQKHELVATCREIAERAGRFRAVLADHGADLSKSARQIQDETGFWEKPSVWFEIRNASAKINDMKQALANSLDDLAAVLRCQGKQAEVARINRSKSAYADPLRGLQADASPLRDVLDQLEESARKFERSLRA